MAWQEDLLPGEFNGIAIGIPSSGRRLGRKTVPNEYPGRDGAFGEDLGRLAREYNVTAILVGPDYLIARQAMDAELETPGPYTYVDPWDGEQVVIMQEPARSIETTRRGGSIEYTLRLKQHKEQEFPQIFDPSAQLKKAAVDAKVAVENDFKKRFSLGKIVSAIFRVLGNVNTAMRVAKGKISSKLSTIDKLAAEIDAFNDSLNDLVNTPQALANKLNGLMGSIKQLAKTIRDNAIPFSLQDGNGIGRGDFDPIVAVLEANAEILGVDTETSADDFVDDDREIENDNLKAIDTLNTASNLISSAEVLADLLPNDVAQANNVAEEMNVQFDELTGDPEIGDELFAKMKDVQVALGDYLTTVAKDLPQVAIFVVPENMPALVISQTVHGDASRDAEIIRRNPVKHPLFVRGEVEVVRG